MPTADSSNVPDSMPVSGEILERSMRLNVIAGFFGMFWIVVPLGLPLPLLLRAVEASGVQLGVMSAAWQIAMLAQIPSALIVERLSRRKPFWASVSIVHRLLWSVPALLPWLLPEHRNHWPVIIIAALAFSNMLGQGGTAPWQSWMADLLPSERAGRFWGARHRWLSVGMVTGALLYGILLDRLSQPPREFLGFQLVFAIAALLGVTDILVHCRVHEPAPVRHATEDNLWRRIVAPLKNSDFRRLTLAMGLWTGSQAMLGYTMGLPGFFSMVYVKESLGASYAEASWIFVASGLGAILWTATIGHWIDVRGGRRVMMLLTGWGPVFMLAWLFVRNSRWTLPGVGSLPQAVILIGIVSLLLGGFYSATWVCQVRLTQMVTNPAGRTIAMGVHWSLVGLIGSLGPLFAGWIKDHFSAQWLNPISLDGSPWSYFQFLVILHALIAWLLVRPILRRLSL